MPETDIDNPIYWGEMNGDTWSRYDRNRAQASDHDTRIMWSIYSVVLFVVSAGIAIIWLGTFTKQKVRRNPFNKYILFLGFPDFLYSFLCLVTCLLSAIYNEYYSWEMCQFQAFYLMWGAAANQWVNTVITWEIHQLLLSSNVRRRYFPPTDRQVYCPSAVCYAIALINSLFPILVDKLNWEFFPTPGLQSGFLCIPVETTFVSSLFFWLVVAPTNLGIPILYVTYVTIDVVVVRKILPPQGRRRDLSIYFFR